MKKKNLMISFSALPGVFLGSMLPAAASAAYGAQAVNNALAQLTSLVTAVVSSIGMILLMWGFLELGTMVSSPSGQEQAQGFKRVIGGIITILAPAIAKGFVM